MARKKTEGVVIEHEEVPAAVATAMAETTQQAAEHSMQIMNAYGEGLLYDRTRVVHEARFYMTQSAEAMLEAGRRLVIIKEHEPHGEFIQIVEGQLGMAERTARLMMQAAIKYSSPKLDSKRQALAVLGKTKLFELMVEDDESLEGLADGGTIAGMTLDDIDRMTSRELRQALREARESEQDHQRIIADKNKKIDEQAKKLTRLKKEAPDDVANGFRLEISALENEIEEQIRVNLRNALNGLIEYADDNGLEGDHQTFINAQANMINKALVDVAAELGISLEVTAAVEWEQ